MWNKVSGYRRRQPPVSNIYEVKLYMIFTKNSIFFLVVTLGMAAIVLYGTNFSINYSPYYNEGVSFPVGKVIEVVSDQTEVDEYGLYRGRQDLRVEVLSGEHRGEVLNVINTLAVGHNVYAKTGIRSAFGLVFTFVVIIFLLIPLIIQGAPPVLTSLGMVLCIIIVSLISILGFTKKAYSAMLGTGVGIVFCCIFYAVISRAQHITGHGEYADTGIYRRFFHHPYHAAYL